MRHQLQEVEVVHFVVILRIYVVVHELHHVKVCVIICSKSQQYVNVLRYLPESQGFQDVSELQSIEFLGVTSLQLLDKVELAVERKLYLSCHFVQMNFSLDVALLTREDRISDSGNHVVRVVLVWLWGAYQHSILI